MARQRIATSMILDGTILAVDMASGAAAGNIGALGGSLAGTLPSPTIGTLSQHLLFVDNTYDIGQSGATRPRNVFVGSTLNIAGAALQANGTDVQSTNALIAGNGFLFIGSAKATYFQNTGSNNVTANMNLTVSASLTLSGSSARILGDFFNSPVGSRVHIQSSVANSSTNVGLIPNGTGTTSQIILNANQDPANSARLRISGDSAQHQIVSDFTGTGAYQILTIFQGGAERMRFGTGGQIGFFGSAGATKPTVSGAKGSNAALGSLMAALSSLGLVTDSTSA